MTMANSPRTSRSVGTPVDELRSLTDADVTVTTLDGSVTGTVLSCTRLSVWLVCDDTDVVIGLDTIIGVVAHHVADAA